MLKTNMGHFRTRRRVKFFCRSFSSDVTAAILVYQNNEMAAILVYGTGISSFLFKYFVLFHHLTGATDHVSENDLLIDFIDKCSSPTCITYISFSEKLCY